MKVLLVNGSPNQKGCTHQALQEVSGALNEAGVESEFYWIGNKPIAGCLGCHKCETAGKCVINDQVVDSGRKPGRIPVAIRGNGAGRN